MKQPKPARGKPETGDHKQSSPVGVGVITIITVLLVLCLTIFSTLTLTSAKADLNLSKINAETVTAYYLADAQAAALAADFVAGDSQELEETIPIAGTQSLYLHLVRDEVGDVQTLAWKTVFDEGEVDLGGEGLPVWDGTLPG